MQGLWGTCELPAGPLLSPYLRWDGDQLCYRANGKECQEIFVAASSKKRRSCGGLGGGLAAQNTSANDLRQSRHQAIATAPPGGSRRWPIEIRLRQKLGYLIRRHTAGPLQPAIGPRPRGANAMTHEPPQVSEELRGRC